MSLARRSSTSFTESTTTPTILVPTLSTMIRVKRP